MENLLDIGQGQISQEKSRDGNEIVNLAERGKFCTEKYVGVSQRLQTAMKVYKRRRIGTSFAVEQGVPFGGKKAKLETSKAHVSFDDVTNEDDSNYDGEPLDGVPVKRSCASFDGIVYDDSDDDSDEYPENDYELLLSKGVKRSGSRKRNAPEEKYIKWRAPTLLLHYLSSFSI